MPKLRFTDLRPDDEQHLSSLIDANEDKETALRRYEGTLSLWRRSDGTFMVARGGCASTIRYMMPTIPFLLVGYVLAFSSQLLLNGLVTGLGIFIAYSCPRKYRFFAILASALITAFLKEQADIARITCGVEIAIVIAIMFGMKRKRAIPADQKVIQTSQDR